MTTRQDNWNHQNKGNFTSEEKNQPLVGRCRESVENAVRENPMITTLAVFGLGLGTGALIGGLLASSRESSPRQLSESIGRRVISALSDIVPESMGQKLRG